MRIGVDANVLIAMETAAPDSDRRARIDLLLHEVTRARGKLIIPTPAWAEYLVKADSSDVAELFKLKRAVEICPFDEAAATEWAARKRVTLTKGRRVEAAEARRKASFDEQIVAIAKVQGCARVLSSDERVRARAIEAGMAAGWIDDLPLPASARQGKLDLHSAPVPATAPAALPPAPAARAADAAEGQDPAAGSW